MLAKCTSARDNHVLVCNFAKYSPIFKNFFSLSDSVINLLLIWLLTIPAHLKHVATLPCNLSLMACSADISVSQGSVATYARCSGIFDFDIHLTANLPRNLPVIKILKSVKNRQNYGQESVAPFFWPTLYIL